MRPETTRFILILACTCAAFLVADVSVKWVRNGVEDWRMGRVSSGMTEAEAVRVTGHPAIVVSNGVKQIAFAVHKSLLETLFSNGGSSSRIIIIQDGRVSETFSMNFIQ